MNREPNSIVFHIANLLAFGVHVEETKEESDACKLVPSL